MDQSCSIIDLTLALVVVVSENNALMCDVAADTDGAKMELVLDDIDGDRDMEFALVFGRTIAFDADSTSVDVEEDEELSVTFDDRLVSVEVLDIPHVVCLCSELIRLARVDVAELEYGVIDDEQIASVSDEMLSFCSSTVQNSSIWPKNRLHLVLVKLDDFFSG